MDTQSACRVGAPVSLTGRYAAFGTQVLRALLLWEQESGSPRARLVWRDDASSRAGAAEMARQLLLHDRVDLLLGPYGSDLTAAVCPVAHEMGRLVWNHGGASDALSPARWPGLVNILSPASHYFVGVIDLISERRGPGTRLALAASPRGSFPAQVARGARLQAERARCTLVADVSYPSPGESMGSLAAALRDAAPDLILGVGTLAEDIALADALTRAGPLPCAAAFVGAGVRAFGDALGVRAEGMFGPSQWEPGVDAGVTLGPSASSFVTAYVARWGRPPDYPAAQAYAAALIAARCAEEGGASDQRLIQVTARRLRVRTLFGDFGLDPRTAEQVGHRMLTVQWRTGRTEVVKGP